MKARPIMLTILDGWGHRDETQYNAIAQANTPNWDRWWAEKPHCLINAAGHSVGLPEGQMGNSEVGHMHLGAGRHVDQNLTRINKAIENGAFNDNPAFCAAIDDAVKNNKALHLLGLLSPGGVHSHENHFHALIDLAEKRGAKKIYCHAFLDGRDTPPKSAKASLEKLENHFKKLNCGRIATISGRFYAMDRDKRWDRTETVYHLLVQGKATQHATDPVTALEEAYARNETDEFVLPTIVGNAVTINDGDSVIFMNFRADRARQLSHALRTPNFYDFVRNTVPRLAHFITLTLYDIDLATNLAFPPQHLKNVLGEYLSEQGLTQLRIAETEKYAHVTFFFSGGIEKPFEGEERTLIPSPPVTTYDLQPEMSAPEMTKKIIDAIQSEKFDVIICNFANADMVGHTGDFEATKQAIECLDHCLGDIATALDSVGGEMIITADHGNAEFMFNEKNQQAHTAHTNNLVPVIYLGREAVPTTDEGTLCDIAPTLLHLLNLPQPKEMTGKILFKSNNGDA